MNALAIMARAPQLYKTKTRLAAEIGAEEALRAHTLLVEDTLTRLSDLSDVTTQLWVTRIEPATLAWGAAHQVDLYQQPAGDLGQRMSRILKEMLDKGAQKACLVGTDCPLIDDNYVRQAFDSLVSYDVVIGPVEDGGYGLIGLKRAYVKLFEDIAWGSALVLQQTLHQAASLNLRVHLLDTVWDVDTPSDWRRYQAFISR